MRTATINRETAETQIVLTLNLDGRGKSTVDSGCGFLDHMLTLFAKHGAFDLTVTCHGDLHVDSHHTLEDIGICLGQAFAQCLGDKKGIIRYGSMILPMDEALLLSAVDLSGRPHLEYGLELPARQIGNFDTELAEEFWLAFVRNSACTLHIQELAGRNTHHLIEATFKSVARTLRQAVAIDPKFADEIPSTKGVLA